jgi:iron complex transport system substrate-binding protein
MKPFLITLAFVVAFALAALLVGPPLHRVEAASHDTAAVTDVLGRTVQVRTPVRRMILGEGRQLYLVAALDTADPLQRVVGWRNDLMQADPATYALYRERFPRLAALPQLGRIQDGSFDVERALALEPDVVVLNIEDAPSEDAQRTIERLAKVGIAVVYVDFRHKPVENTVPTIRLLGRMLGREQRAEALIAFRETQIRKVTDVLARSSSSASAATRRTAASPSATRTSAATSSSPAGRTSPRAGCRPSVSCTPKACSPRIPTMWW